jgi:hypothetical protein
MPISFCAFGFTVISEFQCVRQMRLQHKSLIHKIPTVGYSTETKPPLWVTAQKQNPYCGLQHRIKIPTVGYSTYSNRNTHCWLQHKIKIPTVGNDTELNSPLWATAHTVAKIPTVGYSTKSKSPLWATAQNQNSHCGLQHKYKIPTVGCSTE